MAAEEAPASSPTGGQTAPARRSQSLTSKTLIPTTPEVHAPFHDLLESIPRVEISVIVFPRERVAVYVDGCFWHRCPQHGVLPKANAAWWRLKLQTNVDRDRRGDRVLLEAGWTVVRVWEHESAATAAERIKAVVRALRT